MTQVEVGVGGEGGAMRAKEWFSANLDDAYDDVDEDGSTFGFTQMFQAHSLLQSNEPN